MYLDKPVVFYQFDQERYIDDVGSYVDFATELPGTVCEDEGACVQAVLEYIESGFEMTNQDKERAHRFLNPKRRDNRARTYNFLIDKGL